MAKRRGAGNRGGRGMAGTGKRADQNKPSIWKNTKYFGKYGFKKKNTGKPIKPVNLQYFEQKADKLVEKKLIIKQGDIYVIDTKKLGFNKVLGCGKLTKKLNITSSLNESHITCKPTGILSIKPALITPAQFPAKLAGIVKAS